MTPSTGTFVLLNRSTARRASISDKSCGVDTITAPAGRERWISEIWMSPVPAEDRRAAFGVAPVRVEQLGKRAGRHRPAPRQSMPGRHKLTKRQKLDSVGFDRNQLFVLGPRLLPGCRARSAARAHRRPRRSGRPSCQPSQARLRGSRETVDLPTPPLPLPIAIERPMRLRCRHCDPRFGYARCRQRRRAHLLLERWRSLCAEPRRIDDDRRDAVRQLARADALVVG